MAETLALFRKATEVAPADPLPRNNLARVLEEQGRWAEALTHYRAALAVDPQNAHARSRLRFVERLAALAPLLPAFLRGEFRCRSNEERLTVAFLCQQAQHYRAAIEFWVAAFAADRQVADDLSGWYRYNAACCAARAGTGQGRDAARLDGKEKARLRGQALTWLRADLAL